MPSIPFLARRRRGLAIALVAATASLLAGAWPRAAAAQIAVIVNPGAPVSDVSLEDLRRYFLGKSTAFGSTRVEVVEHPPARRAFYRSLLGLSEDEVRRRWVGLAFRGEAPGVPHEIADATELRRFVAEHRGAITFVDARTVDASVKVLTVGGKRPTDAGYPLR